MDELCPHTGSVGPTSSSPRPSGLGAEPALTLTNAVLELRVFWGRILLDIRHLHQGSILAGEERDCDVWLPAEVLPTQRFAVVERVGASFVLSLTREMVGEVELHEGIPTSVDALRRNQWLARPGAVADVVSLSLPLGARAVLHCGDITLAVRFVVAAAPLNKRAPLDLPYVNSLLVSLFLHVVVVATLLTYPYDAQALQLQRFERAVQVFLDARPPATQPKPPQPPKQRRRTPRAPRVPSAPALAHPDVSRGAAGRARLQGDIRRFLLSGLSGFGVPGSTEPLSESIRDVVATGMGEAPGPSPRGSLTRGGGVGHRRDIGDIDTGGQGVAREVGLGPRTSHDMLVDLPEPPRVEGALSAEAIDNVVKKNRDQLRYCYELQLQRHHNLEGRLVVAWQIAADGTVAKAHVRASTLSTPEVGRCVLERLRRWRFPEPQGGGVVSVTYPFVFVAR